MSAAEVRDLSDGTTVIPGGAVDNTPTEMKDSHIERGVAGDDDDGGSGGIVVELKDGSKIVAGNNFIDDEDEQIYNYDYSRWYRWALMGLYLLISLIGGPGFFNWPPFDDMYNWANANVNLCDPSDPTYELLAHGVISCDAKILANENLSGIAASIMYIFDFVAGILLDSIGAKLTCTFGLILQLIGWILLAASSPTGFNGYKSAIVLMAAGCDPTLFGMLPVASLFPGWGSTAISAIGTIRSLSFANGLVMRGIWNGNREHVSLRGIAFVWALLIAALLVCAVLFVPWQPFPHLAGIVRDERYPSYKKTVNRRPKFNLSKFYDTAKKQVKDTSKSALHWTYGVLLLIACVQLLRNSYYGNSYKVHVPDTKDFYEISSPLTVIPCPFLGILADRVSSALTLAFIVLCAALSMLFAAFRGGKGLQCISIVLNWLFNSFVSSEFYVYLAYNYPLAVYGKLAGFTLLIAGMIGLCGAPMNSFVDRTGKYASMDYFVAFIGIAAACAAVSLHFFVERNTRKEKRRLAENAKEAAHRERLSRTRDEGSSAIGDV